MNLPSRPNYRFVAALLAAFATPHFASADAARPTVDFTKDIQPILESRCLACHGSGKQEAGLRLDRKDDLFKGGDSGPPVEKGKSAVSLLVERIATGDASMRMPPEGTALSTEEVAKLKTWIDHGAAWPDGVSLAERTKADKSWWSLRPLSKFEPPARSDIPAAWAANSIDRFIFDEMEKHGLSPSSPADRRTLIRRATYDLIGLPPTPEEVSAFENDKAPDAYEKLIDRLLASPHYGEHWGRHWLDVVRFGESTGFERNVIIDNAWPFRDYVIRSFNEDKPFDRLTLEHLAGDVIGKDQPDVEVGATFLVAGAYDNVGNQDPVQAKIIRANTLDDMVTATGTAFLGLTINCARCHNHKFDPIPQADYYRIQSAFAGVFHGERALATAEERKKRQDALAPLEKKQRELTAEKAKLEQEAIEQAKPAFANKKYPFPKIDRHWNEDRFTPVKARFVRMTPSSNDLDPHSTGGLRLDEFEVWTSDAKSRNVALTVNGGKATAASRVAEDADNAYSANLLTDGKFSAKWFAVGDPRVTIELAREESIDRVVTSSDRVKAFSPDNRNAIFVGEYILEVSLDGEKWTKVFDSSDRTPINETFLRARLLRHSLDDKEKERLRQIGRELAATEKAINAVPKLREVWAGRFSKPTEITYIHQGGDPGKQGDLVAPASLNVLSDVTKPFELAKDSDEGQRRVELAKWLVASDNPLTPRVLANRIWYYHFGTGIVETPSDFGYLGGRPTHPELLDWLARRLHHYGWKLKPLHREIMLSQTYQQSGIYRDNMAKIDSSARYLWRFPPRRLFSEEVRDTILQVSGRLDPKMGGPGFRLYKYLQDNVATYIPLDVHGPETWRRAVYHQNARASRVDVLSDFDCPDNAFSAPTRAATTTPLQALTLLNHSFTREMAKNFSERVQRDAGKEDVSRQIRRAFELAYSRLPTEKEQASASVLVRKHGLSTLCRAILNSNELVYLQ